jgi:hypothetical protein
MPETAFFVPLGLDRRILVLRSTTKGRFNSFAIVLMLLTPEGWVDVGRFDTAHGIPHQDILGEKRGLAQKVWYDYISPKEVFHLGIETFKHDHERIITEYLRN